MQVLVRRSGCGRSGRDCSSDRASDMLYCRSARLAAGSRSVIRFRRRSRSAIFLLALFALALGFGLDGPPAFCQITNQNQLHFVTRPRQEKAAPIPSNAPMLVQADQIKYDYPNNTVAAVGNV